MPNRAPSKRLRLLQLKVAGKKKGPQYQSIELTSMLEEPSPEQAVRRAKRYRFPKTVEARIDKDAGELCDLSVGGAQVLSPKQPEVNKLVTLSFESGQSTVSCEARIVWAWLEPHSQGRKLRYRAGMSFTKLDETAIETFINKEASKER
jgi:PilZ domain